MADRSARAQLFLAGLFGAMAVACAAYAAHGLGPVKGERAVELWRTGSQIQMVHAVLLVGLVALRARLEAVRGLLAAAGWLVALGSLLFPGAVYLLGWFGPSALGAVAPIGGLSLILGWLCVALAAARAS